MGKTRRKSGSSDRRRPTICGVSDDVAQVSITSVSARKVVLPQAQGRAGGRSAGSTGSSASSATAISPHSSQYHSGKGTPKARWREMHQSQLRFSTHCA